MQCTGLSGSLVIPYSVTTIEKSAFYECRNIQTLYLPTNLSIHTTVNSGSFVYCRGLTDIYYGGTAEDWRAHSLGSIGNMVDVPKFTVHYESYTDKGLDISGDAHSVNLGETLTLQAAWGGTTPAYSWNFSWSVSDPSVLEQVSSDCTLAGEGFSAALTATFRALKDGEVTVSAYGPNDSSDSCTVTAAGSRMITYLRHPDQMEGKPLFLKADESKTLSFSYMSNGDLDAELEEIQWEVEGDDAQSISLTNIQAEITAENAALLTATVTALSPGDPVTIRVSGPDGCKDTCQVQVAGESILILEGETGDLIDDRVLAFRQIVGEPFTLQIRYEANLDEETAAQRVQEWDWYMSTEDFLADPDMVEGKKELAFRKTNTAIPMDLTCKKEGDGVYRVEATFVPAMEGVTALRIEHPDGAGDLCAVYATFDSIQYHASLYSNNQKKEIVDFTGFLLGETPATLILKSLDETGGDTATAIWYVLDHTLKGLDNPSNMVDFMFEEKDMYYALLLMLVEEVMQESQENHAQVLTGYIKNTHSYFEDVVSLLYREPDIGIDLPAWFDKENKTSVFKNHESHSWQEKLKGVNTGAKILFVGADTAAGLYDSYQDHQTAAAAAASILSVSQDMQKVLQTMRQERPGNAAFSEALDQLIRQMQTSEAELIQELQTGSVKLGGWKVAQTGAELFWDRIKDQIKFAAPEAYAIYCCCVASSTASKILFNTDDTVEQYYKMLAMQEIKDAAKAASRKLESDWKSKQTTESAQTYLVSGDLLYKIFDADCEMALEYVEIIDSSLANKIENGWNTTFGEGKFAGAVSAFEGYQNDLEDAYQMFRGAWISWASVDYPGTLLTPLHADLHLELTGTRPIRRVVRIACPVDVYVRDSQGGLAAYVKGDAISSSDDNVAVMLAGDAKIVAIYNGGDYTFEYVGTGSGTMNVTDTHYSGEGEELRTVQYYDLPLSTQTVYTYDAQESLRKNGGGLIRPSGNSESAAAYQISVICGVMDRDNGDVLSAKAYAGERIFITACIPEGCEFTGWTSSRGVGVFEDPLSPVTALRMPAGNTVVTAEYRLSAETLAKRLIVTDENGTALEEIPTGTFLVSAHAVVPGELELLAAYGADGQMLFTNLPVLSESDPTLRSFNMDNSDGKITELKFFCLTETGLPLQETPVFPIR